MLHDKMHLQLDAMYGSFLAKDMISFDIELGDSTTYAKKHHDAFMLKDPNTKVIYSGLKSLDNEDQNQAVIRAIIPYKLCYEMLSDYLTGIYILSVYKQKMTKELIENFSTTEAQIKPTFKLVGMPDRFFRENENYAGLEIRIYSCKEVEK